MSFLKSLSASKQGSAGRSRTLAMLCTSLLAITGLLLLASSSQAIYIDLAGIERGSTQRVIEGRSVTIESREYRPMGIEHLSITFDDGPVGLNTVDLYMQDARALVIANLMGNVSLVQTTEAGPLTLAAGGIQGARSSFLSFGGRSTILGLDFDLVSVGGSTRVEPSSPIPEPHAALLFATGMGLVAIRRRQI
ncbi:MAG: PEP-CTERM sorting domain-containing protein [bacterium]